MERFKQHQQLAACFAGLLLYPETKPDRLVAKTSRGAAGLAPEAGSTW